MFWILERKSFSWEKVSVDGGWVVGLFLLKLLHSEEVAGEGVFRRLVSVVRFYVALVLVGIYWMLGVLMVVVLGGLTRIFLNERRHRELGHRVLGGLFRGFFLMLGLLGIVRIDDHGLRGVDGGGEGLIVASNHPSLWDAPLLIRRFTRVSCIMKREILENPLLRSGAAFAGFVPNRPGLAMVRRATAVLKEGGGLLMFPEGTRTSGGVVNEFRPGIGLLAKGSGAGVLPVFIRTDSDFLRKEWPVWRCPRLPVRVRLEVGEVLWMREGEGADDFLRRVERRFRMELGGS